MASPSLICDECGQGTLLYMPYTPITPGSIANASRLTAEERSKLNIICSSRTCPSRSLLEESPTTMNTQMDNHFEQPGVSETVEPHLIMDGQQPQYSNDQVPQQVEHHEQQEVDNELELQLQSLFDVPHEVDGKLVHKGEHPCRRCYQTGRYCFWPSGSDSCTVCQPERICNRYLGGAKPYGFWTRMSIIGDYAAPFTIKASRIRRSLDKGDVVEYQVKYATKSGRAGWQPAEGLKAFPWILKKFHRDMPQMPGPEGWLVEEEGDDFFYGSSDHISM